MSLVDRKRPGSSVMSLRVTRRSMGVDFGPSYVGLALSLGLPSRAFACLVGGINTMPMGTLRTGKDWKELAIKIARIASTSRVKELPFT